MRNSTNFSGKTWKWGRSSAKRKTAHQAKNVNLCLLDSVESIAQGMKILLKTTGGYKVNPNSFGS